MGAVSVNPFDPKRLSKWEACRFPERPPDKETEFILGCPACVIKLLNAISMPPPPGHFDGYWRDRDSIRASLIEKGVIAP